MRIEAVETVRVGAHPNVLWVRIGAEGETGLGETYFGAAAVEADVHDRLAPILLGQDAREIERLNRAMQPYTGFTGTGAEVRALSAVDVALWDLAGKATGRPLHDLLGGRMRPSIQVYNTCAGPSYVSQSAAVRPDNFGTQPGRDYEDLTAFLNEPEALAADLMEMGIHSMKIWPWRLRLSSGCGRPMAMRCG